jgi:hypothetical protein
VTQFAVRVNDPERLEAVARVIDDEFRHDAEPTQTSPEKAFVAQAGADVVNLVGFTHYLGWGCLIAVLALIANAIVLSVQDRIREHAVLQTLGYRSGLIARMIVAEGLLLGPDRRRDRHDRRGVCSFTSAGSRCPTKGCTSRVAPRFRSGDRGALAAGWRAVYCGRNVLRGLGGMRIVPRLRADPGSSGDEIAQTCLIVRSRMMI